jgi:hypothetical protein
MQQSLDELREATIVVDNKEVISKVAAEDILQRLEIKLLNEYGAIIKERGRVSQQIPKE